MADTQSDDNDDRYKKYRPFAWAAIVTLLLGWIPVDLWLLRNGGQRATISGTAFDWGQRDPSVPYFFAFGFGFLTWHLFRRAQDMTDLHCASEMARCYMTFLLGSIVCALAQRMFPNVGF